MEIIKGGITINTTERQLYQVVQYLIPSVIEEFIQAYKKNFVDSVKQFMYKEREIFDFLYYVMHEIGLVWEYEELEKKLAKIEEEIDKERNEE
ncbi:MAG TPA: hypothetical protein PLC87_12065 [Bacteroidales bacterium]|nr:hypothetical protein [Bacteroidales bacterium]